MRNLVSEEEFGTLLKCLEISKVSFAKRIMDDTFSEREIFLHYVSATNSLLFLPKSEWPYKHPILNNHLYKQNNMFSIIMRVQQAKIFII
jgi:hypothetical protein